MDDASRRNLDDLSPSDECEIITKYPRRRRHKGTFVRLESSGKGRPWIVTIDQSDGFRMKIPAGCVARIFRKKVARKES